MNNFTTKHLEVDINSVHPNKWNPNVEPPLVYEKLLESIKQHGFTQPILVREYVGEYQIIDGEHRWKACKELKFTNIKIESLGEIDDKIAKLLTLLLNNIHGEDDVLKRAKILKQLSEGQLALFPATADEIAEELKLLNFDFEQFRNAEFAEEEKDPLEEGFKKMWEAMLIFKKVHDKSRSTKLRLLIEQYTALAQTFKEVLGRS